MGRRIFNFLLLVAMLVGAAVTYDMKHKAEVAAAEVARLQAEISKEKDAVALLKAEWSLLTQPGRLQSVVEKYSDHFQLQPFSPSQIATINEIPMKPIGAPDPLASSIARLAADETGKVR